jgi:hypothetical protein
MEGWRDQLDTFVQGELVSGGGKTQAQPAPLPPAYRRALDLVAVQRRHAADADDAVAALRAKLAKLLQGASELDGLLGQLARGAGLDPLAYEPRTEIERALRVHVVGGIATPVQVCTAGRLDLLESRIGELAGLLVSDEATAGAPAA